MILSTTRFSPLTKKRLVINNFPIQIPNVSADWQNKKSLAKKTFLQKTPSPQTLSKKKTPLAKKKSLKKNPLIKIKKKPCGQKKNLPKTPPPHV